MTAKKVNTHKDKIAQIKLLLTIRESQINTIFQ